ncbi:uncharacterized protein BT62DRAFT_936188 [Guyanagaster necrorhizus]|uniref:Aminoglycoside phosphotransferase domain-containing protein n=1 Tax=Guyanagaster necrorhizus TaxID=856835 RepID=A0A9P7VJM3_9AGAR|nr:uncharacterized protein BT62DRAFT_936188 [Guyanagaster necrorhizus MCA 3950]KAG7442348.1 hypothetical protein BT62DRAFT_936188 [Guyanagaster necrorhizus MCA 3950]
MHDHGRVLVRVSYWCFLKGIGYGISTHTKLPSEVATLRFLEAHTTIPVPRVFFYDNDTDNAVGGAWMAMEYIKGVPANWMWQELSADQQHQLCTAIADVYSELMNIRLPQIGSLFQDLHGQFFVGPMTTMQFGENGQVPPDPHRCGPFLSVSEWLIAVASGYLKFSPRVPHTEQKQNRMKSVINEIRGSDLVRDDATPFVLDHVDFSMQNILIHRDNPTQISAVIDWEGARFVPMWAANPIFRWPMGFPAEESEHFLQVISERISENVPQWKDAFSHGTDDLRSLGDRAVHSTQAGEGEVDWTKPPYHHLSGNRFFKI